MTLTDKEKERIKEEESFRKSVQKDLGKVPWWKPKGFGAWIFIIIIVLAVIGNISSKSLSGSNVVNSKLAITPTRTPAEQKTWDQSKAGKICKDNPTWSEKDCTSLADNLIWVGMSYDMLVYKRGEPNSANPSNYGGKTRWQWCWHDNTPSCFYDNNDDGIVDSYN